MSGNVLYLKRAAEVRQGLPEVIRLLLAVNRKSARSLAGALGISEQSLSDRLNARTRITSEEVAVCALFFGVEEGVLYRDPDSFRRQLTGSAAAIGEPTDRLVNSAGQRPRRGAPPVPDSGV